MTHEDQVKRSFALRPEHRRQHRDAGVLRRQKPERTARLVGAGVYWPWHQHHWPRQRPGRHEGACKQSKHTAPHPLLFGHTRKLAAVGWLDVRYENSKTGLHGFYGVGKSKIADIYRGDGMQMTLLRSSERGGLGRSLGTRRAVKSGPSSKQASSVAKDFWSGST